VTVYVVVPKRAILYYYVRSPSNLVSSNFEFGPPTEIQDLPDAQCMMRPIRVLASAPLFFAWSRIKFSKHVDLKESGPAAMPLYVQALLGPLERFAIVEMMFGFALSAQTWCGAGA
jgi:hypothetical protein